MASIYTNVLSEEEFHYLNHLRHADMLVARDNNWRNIFHSDDY